MNRQPRPRLGLVFAKRSPIEEARAILDKYHLPHASPTAGFIPDPGLEDDLERMLSRLK